MLRDCRGRDAAAIRQAGVRVAGFLACRGRVDHAVDAAACHLVLCCHGNTMVEGNRRRRPAGDPLASRARPRRRPSHVSTRAAAVRLPAPTTEAWAELGLLALIW